MRKVKTIVALLLLIISATTSTAQPKEIVKGMTYFESGEWTLAIDLLKEGYPKSDKDIRAEVTFMIAECYNNLKNPKVAETWYKKAINRRYTDPIAILKYADMLKMNKKHDEAAIQYKKYQEKVSLIPPPEIRWIWPDNYYTKTQNNTISIRAKVKSVEMISSLKILVNGKTVATTNQISITNSNIPNEKIIEYLVQLNLNKNKIQIYAENIYISMTSTERVVLYENEEWEKPNLYMVSIGISEHFNPSQNLSFADKDAQAMSKIFIGQEGKLYKDVKVKELCNENATRTNIIKALQWLYQNATQKDVAILFIAAHGYNELEEYYILPYDGDPDNLMVSSVDKSFIERTLGNSPARVLLFLDTCHGGKLGENLIASRGKNDITEALRDLSSKEFGMVIMSGTKADELSQERPEWGHGVFTKALLDGLLYCKANQTEDNIIYLKELDFYVSERVKELTLGKQHATTKRPSSISRFPIFVCD